MCGTRIQLQPLAASPSLPAGQVYLVDRRLLDPRRPIVPPGQKPTPLQAADDPARAVAEMVEAVDRYFRSGQRVCLVGVIALGAARDSFATRLTSLLVRMLGRVHKT